MSEKKVIKSKKKTGRKEKITFTPRLLKQMEEFGAKGLRIGQIGDLLGVSRTTWADYRKLHSEIDIAYNVGKANCVSGLISTLMTYAKDSGRKDSGAIAFKLLDRVENSVRGNEETDKEVVVPTVVNIVLEDRSREDIKIEKEVE